MLTHQIGASIQGWRAAVLLWQGRWADARDAAAESARIAEATRSLWQLSIARAIDGYAQWMLERRPEAVEGIVAVTDWLLPRDSGLFRSLNHGWLAEGLQTLGRPAEARGMPCWRCSAAAAATASAWRWRVARWRTRRRRRGEPDAAQRQLACAYRVARGRDSAHELAVTQLAEAELAIAAGAAAHVRAALIDQAAAAFDTMAMEWHLAQALQPARAPVVRAGRAGVFGVSISSTGEPVARNVPASNSLAAIASITPRPIFDPGHACKPQRPDAFVGEVVAAEQQRVAPQPAGLLRVQALDGGGQPQHDRLRFGSGLPLTTGRRHTIGGTGSPCIVSSIGRSSAARTASRRRVACLPICSASSCCNAHKRPLSIQFFMTVRKLPCTVGANPSSRPTTYAPAGRGRVHCPVAPAPDAAQR